jgi:hypothetical protein
MLVFARSYHQCRGIQTVQLYSRASSEALSLTVLLLGIFLAGTDFTGAFFTVCLAVLLDLAHAISIEFAKISICAAVPMTLLFADEVTR